MRLYYTGPLLGTTEPRGADVLTTPRAGSFYQTKKGDTVWAIAKAAYGSPRPGIFTINNSPWNSHIRKASTGWEAYKVQGLQLTAHYDPTNAPSSYGSGKNYPVLWIPPAGGGEPKTPAPPCPKCPPPQIVEKVVEVPGPERIVEVPGPERIVEKVVEMPGPERIVEKRVEVPTGESGPRWPLGVSIGWWGIILWGVARRISQ